MTKRLPPPEPTVTDAELDAARDDDAPVELVETGRAKYQGPVGLSFAIAVDVRPVQRAFRRLAKKLERQAEAEKALAPTPDDDDPPTT